MAIIFYLLAAGFVVPAGIYFYFFFRRLLTLFEIEKKTKKSRALAVLLAAAVAALGIRMMDFSFMIMLHLLLACFFMELANFLLKRIPQEKFQRVWSFLYKSGIISVVVAVVVLTYGYFNMHNVQRMEYTVEAAKAVGSDLKVVQISDLHTGTSLDKKEMEECFKQIQAEKADLLVLTGDIFDETTTLGQMKETVDMLSKIETTYGSYYIFGNHDVNQYTASPAYTSEQLKEALAGAGIRVLEDDVMEISEDYTLIGRLDASVEKRASIDSLISQVPEKNFLLLLDHQPVDLAENAEAGIDLQLSGHTHAGQIWPMGFLSKLVGVNEEYYGIHDIKNFRVIVSSGMAGWGYPIRTEGPSEYVVINIVQPA